MRELNIRAWFSLFAVGAVLSVTLAQILVSIGRPFPVSPISLTVTIGLLGPVVFALTLPVRRYQKSLERFQDGKAERPARVNPFYAFRVLVLSRASALAGSGFVGWHSGLLASLAILGVAGGSILPSLLWGLLASCALLGFAIWAEQNCKIPGDRTPSDGATT
jgi:hypothetical protein